MGDKIIYLCDVCKFTHEGDKKDLDSSLQEVNIPYSILAKCDRGESILYFESKHSLDLGIPEKTKVISEDEEEIYNNSITVHR